MSLRSASSSWTRFWVPEPRVEDFWSFVQERLAKGRHRPKDQAVEKNVGFVSLDDLFDTDFAYANYHKGEYVAFQFRVDRKRVPGLLLKQHLREALLRYRRDHEGAYPNRHERQKIRDEVHQWLMERLFPQPSGCDVIWHPVKHWLIVGTTSSKMLETFLEYFEELFQLHLVPLYHANWALYSLPLKERQKDVLASMVPLKSPQAMHEGRFLGYEFLTWLWFFIDIYEGKVENETLPATQISLGERLVLSHPDDGKEKVICTTQAGELHEARTALQQGKLVDEIQFHVSVGENDYDIQMDRDLWAIKKVKTPKQLSEETDLDADALFLEKMYFLEEVFAVLDTLFMRFLNIRLDPGWESDAFPMVRRWASGMKVELV